MFIVDSNLATKIEEVSTGIIQEEKSIDLDSDHTLEISARSLDGKIDLITVQVYSDLEELTDIKFKPYSRAGEKPSAKQEWDLYHRSTNPRYYRKGLATFNLEVAKKLFKCLYPLDSIVFKCATHQKMVMKWLLKNEFNTASQLPDLSKQYYPKHEEAARLTFDYRIPAAILLD